MFDFVKKQFSWDCCNQVISESIKIKLRKSRAKCASHWNFLIPLGSTKEKSDGVGEQNFLNYFTICVVLFFPVKIMFEGGNVDQLSV